MHDFVAKVFGDVAVVHNRQHVRGRLRGAPFETRTWCEKADVGTS